MNTQQKQLLGAGAGGIGLLIIYSRTRRKNAASGAPTVATSGGGIQPYTPQSPVTLQPGESVYDPNSEGLLGTGFAPGTGSTTFDPGQTVYDPSAGGTQPTSSPAPPQSSAPAGPGYVVNVNYPPNVVKHHPKPPAAKRPRNIPANAKHTGPKSPGPNWRGVGGGWWVPPRKQPAKA